MPTIRSPSTTATRGTSSRSIAARASVSVPPIGTVGSAGPTDAPSTGPRSTAVSAKLTTSELAALNKKADVEKQDPEAVADAWAKENGLAT